jgi:glyoxylase-like metal-dependent hydrolase (beta-lactamase superfamily II)
MIKRWDLVTIGNISRNRYWGEGDDRGRRAVYCTCTLIRGEGWNLLVDPSLEERDRMQAELDRRTGLSVADITHIFTTHCHEDHHAGMRHFEKAQWFAGAGVAEQINASGKYAQAVAPVAPDAAIVDGVSVLTTPGHAVHHYSVRFECEGLTVVIAGDAAMTRDFFRDRRGYYNTVDHKAVAQSIDRMAQIADVVVPGHDNYFLTRRRPIPALA